MIFQFTSIGFAACFRVFFFRQQFHAHSFKLFVLQPFSSRTCSLGSKDFYLSLFSTENLEVTIQFEHFVCSGSRTLNLNMMNFGGPEKMHNFEGMRLETSGN